MSRPGIIEEEQSDLNPQLRFYRVGRNSNTDMEPTVIYPTDEYRNKNAGQAKTLNSINKVGIPGYLDSDPKSIAESLFFQKGIHAKVALNFLEDYRLISTELFKTRFFATILANLISNRISICEGEVPST